MLEILGSHICNNMDGPQGPYSNCNKLGRERQIPYNYLIFRIKKLFRNSKTKLKYREKTVVATSGVWNWEKWQNCFCFLYKIKGKLLIAQSHPTLCNSTDCSPAGSFVKGVLQGRILEWVVSPFSRGSSQNRDWTQVSCIVGRFFTICTKLSLKNKGGFILLFFPIYFC